MGIPGDRIEDLRSEIDQIDDALHDLLIPARRGQSPPSLR